MEMLLLIVLAVTALAAGQHQRVVCYYENWSVYREGQGKMRPEKIDPNLCTHLIYAFGAFSNESGLRPFDEWVDIDPDGYRGGYANFNDLKHQNKQLRTLLSIGGTVEGSAEFSPIAADPERRTSFARNVVLYLRQYNFDGLDLDWQSPGSGDGANKTEDLKNYVLLVKELRAEFEQESSKTGRERLLLTMTLPIKRKTLNRGYDLPSLIKEVDFMNILSYNYHLATDVIVKVVKHHAPLNSTGDKLAIHHSIEYYMTLGLPLDKLVLGIPTFGRSFTLSDRTKTKIGSEYEDKGIAGEFTMEEGFLAYYEICDKVKKQEWTIKWPSPDDMGPIAYKENQWVGYDDADIVRTKARYVAERGLGGIMFWSIGNADFHGKCHGRPYPLIEAGKEELLAATNSVKGHTISMSTTTPVPGSDFSCKGKGLFPNMKDCEKYFWCLDSGDSQLGIIAHQLTCPLGLVFSTAAESCDYDRTGICTETDPDRPDDDST